MEQMRDQFVALFMDIGHGNCELLCPGTKELFPWKNVLLFSNPDSSDPKNWHYIFHNCLTPLKIVIGMHENPLFYWMTNPFWTCFTKIYPKKTTILTAVWSFVYYCESKFHVRYQMAQNLLHITVEQCQILLGKFSTISFVVGW